MFDVWAKDALDDDRLITTLDSPSKAQRLAARLVELGMTHEAWTEQQ